MIWLAVGALAVLSLLVAVGVRRGRVQLRSCCPADPRLDLRMRAAFDDEATRVPGDSELGAPLGADPPIGRAHPPRADG